MTAYFIPKEQNLFFYQSEDVNRGTVSPNKEFIFGNGTASPNNGYIFAGWFDQDGHFVSGDATFNAAAASKSMLLTAKFQTPGSVQYTVSVNETDAGNVFAGNNSYLGKHNTAYDRRIDQTITAVPAPGYEFICWKLNEVELNQYPQTIDPNYNPIFLNNGDTLQAVFAKATVVDENQSAHSDIVISDERKKELEQWLKSLESNKVISGDKTAHAVDYANRIYEIDFNTESALMDLTANLDIAFIIDVSNSILFPANLERTGKTMVLTQANLNEPFPDG